MSPKTKSNPSLTLWIKNKTKLYMNFEKVSAKKLNPKKFYKPVQCFSNQTSKCVKHLLLCLIFAFLLFNAEANSYLRFVPTLNTTSSVIKAVFACASDADKLLFIIPSRSRFSFSWWSTTSKRLPIVDWGVARNSPLIIITDVDINRTKWYILFFFRFPDTIHWLWTSIQLTWFYLLVCSTFPKDCKRHLCSWKQGTIAWVWPRWSKIGDPDSHLNILKVSANNQKQKRRNLLSEDWWLLCRRIG